MTTTTHRTRRAALATTAATMGLVALTATASPAVAATTEQGPTADFLTAELLDVNEFWSRAGVPSTTVTGYFPEKKQSLATSCGVSDDDSMFYCPADDVIVFSLDVAARVWTGEFTVNQDDNRGKPAGDFAVALLIAHEYAHNVQSEVGIDTVGYPVINTELHADCWAGVWMNDSWYAGELHGTDVEEAEATMARIGDYQYTNTKSHGTPDERSYAFRYGYDSGVPADCDGILTHQWR